ncbi:hypothetical protein BJP35_2331 [Enterobacter sp. J49]|nr:hypothetical protein BJP35_2331 [Enterobacter sp. J49]
MVQWEVSYTIFCPETGTAFAVVRSVKNLKLILWYQGEYWLSKSCEIETSASGFIVNGKLRDITVLHVFPFTTVLWEDLILKSRCPGNTDPFIRDCSQHLICRFSLCPFGAIRADTRH